MAPSFLYSLTYCIKEVIKGKIFWILNEKSAGLWGSYGLRQANPLQFIFKALFFYFWITVSKWVSKAIFLDITFKSVGLWGRYGLKQGNPLQNLKISNQIVFFFSRFVVLFNVSKRLSEVRFFDIKWICCLWGRYSLKQGNILYFFQNDNPIIFVTFISLFFDLLYQRGYQR